MYDLKLVMTYAVAAHKQNQNEYINYGETSNKLIILAHLGETSTVFVDHLTDDCADVADNIIQYYKGLTFKALGAKINDFEHRVLGIIQKGTVDAKDVGVIASLPKAYYRAVKRDAKDIEMRRLSKTSEYIASEGAKVKLDMNVLNCSFITRLDCHIVNGVADGNIVCFFTKHGANHWGDSCTVEGRVKRHQISKFHSGKETVLNYVKVVDKT